ncbi:MAG TPA: hypothetical protein VIF15_20005 [Polyangiaceae bacterium]|jgi:hypothetical protein
MKLSIIRSQHERIERRLASIASGDGAQGEQGDQLLALIEDVVAHLAVHRRVLLPASPLFASDALHHESRLRLLLLRLVALSKLGSSQLGETLAELRDVFHAHVEVEEQLVLPELEATLDERALASLDEAIEQTDDDSRARVAALRTEGPPQLLCG